MEPCSSCDLFGFWRTAFEEYADQVISQIMPWVEPTIVAVLVLYWTLRIVMQMAGVPTDTANTAKEILITVAAFFYTEVPSRWTSLIGLCLDQAVNITRAFIDPLGGSSSRPGLEGLLAAIEKPLNIIIDGVHIMWGSTGLNSLPAMMGCGVLLVVYFLLWLAILVEVVWGYTAFIFIQVMGPILLIFYSVPVLRGTATQAWKILLMGLFTLVTLGILTGVSVSLLNKMVGYIPVSGDQITIDATKYLFSQQYMVALGCGFLLLFLKSRFMHLAAQLADAVLNSAPNVLSGAANSFNRMLNRALPNDSEK